MMNQPGIPCGRGSKRLILLAVLTLLLLPVTGRTESSTLRIVSEAKPATAVPAVGEPPLKQDVVDTFMVRFGDVSFSVNFGIDESIDRLRESSGLQSPFKMVAGLGNLTVKVGFSF